MLRSVCIEQSSYVIHVFACENSVEYYKRRVNRNQISNLRPINKLPIQSNQRCTHLTKVLHNYKDWVATALFQRCLYISKVLLHYIRSMPNGQSYPGSQRIMRPISADTSDTSTCVIWYEMCMGLDVVIATDGTEPWARVILKHAIPHLTSVTSTQLTGRVNGNL
jgi:hypothetical protein